jgi:transposase-like protein
VVKNGIAWGKQIYKRQECGYNFVDGDGRTNEKVAAKKAMWLYTLGKTSFTGLYACEYTSNTSSAEYTNALLGAAQFVFFQNAVN